MNAEQTGNVFKSVPVSIKDKYFKKRKGEKRMKRKTRLTALLLAAAMVCGLAGCGNSGKQESSSADVTKKASAEQGTTAAEEESKLFNTDGVLPIVNEPVTLKVLMIDDGEDVANRKAWKWLTEKTGIEFEVQTLTAEEMATKLPLILAGNDLPDIFWRCPFDYAMLESYAGVGKIMQLDDLIEKYGYYTKQVIEAESTVKGAMTASDGHKYSMPQVTGKSALGYMINQNWLDNLNLPVPETLDELYDTLVAFRDQDANGNGDPNDEIPMSFPGSSHMAMRAMVMAWCGFSQYWPATGATFDADANGKVALNQTTDQYRYVLEYLNKLYNEGLLDKNAFTQTSEEHKAKLLANQIGVYTNGNNNSTLLEQGIYYTEMALTSQVNPDVPVLGGSMPYNPNLFAISALTKYPEVCFLLGDYIYSEEASWYLVYGEEGVDFTWKDKDHYQVDYIGDSGNKLFVNNWTRTEWKQQKEDEKLRKNDEIAAKYCKTAFQNYLVFTQEENDIISEIATDLSSVCDEAFVQFITNGIDDASWQEYVDLVKSLRADELTEIYQAAYDRFYAE